MDTDGNGKAWNPKRVTWYLLSQPVRLRSSPRVHKAGGDFVSEPFLGINNHWSHVRGPLFQFHWFLTDDPR
jgi:hypothetical protein